MLKRAVFILKKENAVQEMQALINDLKVHHVEVHQTEAVDSEDTLYITDCESCQKKLHAE